MYLKGHREKEKEWTSIKFYMEVILDKLKLKEFIQSNETYLMRWKPDLLPPEIEESQNSVK